MSCDRIQLSRERLRAAVGDEGWPEALIDAAAELLASSDGKFPAGARRLPADLVSAVQRERLIAAMLRAATEIGYRQATVQDVIDRAGISRPTFYEHFANKEDCFLVAFEATAARLRKRLEAAAAAGEDWRQQLRLAIEDLLRFVAGEPDAARVLVVEARAASAEALLRRDALLDHFATCIDSLVRDQLPDADSRSAITAAGVVGGVEALLYGRLTKGELSDLEALLPSLMYFVVLPYGGHEAANEELALALG